MNQDKFKALIRLLDDTDPEVAEHVERELFSLGTGGIQMLEQAWEETQDSTIQHRIEELIGRIQLSHITRELKEWRLGGGDDLLEGWLLVSQIQYPTMNAQKYIGEVKKMIHRIWLEQTPSMNDIEKLSVINRQIYQLQQLTGNFSDHEKPENNYLTYLIDSRKGNSLTMAMLYYILASSLDLPVQVVNFNGYFAVRYYSHSSHFYIDTYNKGMFFTPQQVQSFLNRLGADENVLHYKHLSHIYLVLQLLQHLIEGYTAVQRPDKAEIYKQLLQSIDIQLNPSESDGE